MPVLLDELRQILYAILAKGKVGTLSLGKKERQRDIFFEPDSAYLLNRAEVHRIVLSPELQKVPNLKQHTILEVVSEARERDETVPEVLYRHGLVDSELLDRLLQAQIREEMLDAIFTCRGSFLFFEGLVPDELLIHEGYAADIFLNRNELAKALRARELEFSAVTRVLPSFEEVFVPTEKGLRGARNLDLVACGMIYELIDGFRTIRQVVQDSFFYEFFVLQLLVGLLEAGVVKKTILPELHGIDTATLTKAQAERVLPLFERAIKYAVNDLVPRESLARVFDILGRTRDAVDQLEIIGDRNLQLGKSEQAARSYSRALALDASNKQLKEKLSRLHAEKASEETAAGNRGTAIQLLQQALQTDPACSQTYCRLMSHMVKCGDSNGLRDLFDQAVRYSRTSGNWEPATALAKAISKAPNIDAALQTKVANLLLDTGNKEDAARLMEAIAAHYSRLGDRRKAGQVYQKILLLDPQREDLRRKTRDMRPPQRRRVLRKRSWIKLALWMALIGGLTYQGWSFFAFARIGRAARSSRRVAHYRAFTKRYPYSVGGFLAARRAANEKQLRTVSTNAEEQRLKALLQRARAQENIGDIAGARRLYNKVRKTAPASIRALAEERLCAISQRAEEARQLLERARALDSAGKPEESFHLMRKLVDTYGETSSAAKAFFPIRIESDPPGGELYLNGVKRGVTPVVIRITEGQPAWAELRLQGHRPFDTELEPSLGPSTRFTLSRLEAWQSTLHEAVSGRAVLRDDALFMVGSDGVLRSFSTTDGRLQRSWPVPGATDVAAGPTLAGTTVAFATNDGRVCSVNRNGNLTISRTQGLITSNLIPLGTSAVCFGTSKKRIQCISLATGRTAWEVGVPKAATRRAVATGKAMIFLCKDGHVRALARHNGNSLWSRAVPPETELSASGDLLFLGNAASATMLEAATGREQWSTTFQRRNASFCLVGPSLWVSSQNGLVRRLDARTGVERVRVQLHGPVTQWLPLGRSLAAGLGGGGLWCLNPTSLQKQWFSALQGSISAMAGNERMLFVVLDDRTLLCFDQNE